MDREAFIETQSLTQGGTKTSKVGGREGKTEEEEGEKIEEEETTGSKEE